MKILHVIPSIDPKYGGPSKAVLDIAEACSRDGLNVSIAFGHRPDELPFIKETEIQLERIKFYPFLYSFPERYSASRDLGVWLQESVIDFDLVHIHSIFSLTSLRAGRIAAAQGVPYIVRPAGSLDRFDLQKKRWLKDAIARWTVRRLLQDAVAIHCTSMKEEYGLDTFGVNVPVKVLPLPVMASHEAGDGSIFRRRYGFAETDFVWLFLSRIDYKKGLDILIPTLALLSEKHPNIRVALCGADLDGYGSLVRAWIDKYRVWDKVRWCGLLTGEEKAHALAGSNCFVLPSMNENFGVAVVEALLAGLPVVVSENVYISNEIAEGGAGWITKPTVESLASVMSTVMDHSSELEQKRKRTKDAGERFGSEKIAPMYSEFYKEIVGKTK